MELPEYQNFKEKGAFFQLNIINTEKKFDEFYAKVTSEPSLLRGISNAKYKIFNSLQRFWFKDDLRNKFAYESFVKAYLAEHSSTILPAYFRGLNITPSFLSLFSFLQHYGAPSALIDFTPSIDVALYFATECITDTGPSDRIEDYFSIFQITESDFELLSDNTAISSVGKMVDFWADYKDDDGNNPFFGQHLDRMIEMHTEKVFLVPNDEKNRSVYNLLSSLNIIAQNGLFIYNGYEEKPLEEALHNFFERAAKFQSSIHDDLDTPESQEINREYFEETLPRNREYLKRLKGNIIQSYEISKSLGPYIKGKLTLSEDVIYPDPKQIGWKMFDVVKNR
ncbi:FRG domain-containing protein [Pedobacter quisquiliarum]|nr:FRG domain-containing protein [Pedobacter quisquiliarum]